MRSLGMESEGRTSDVSPVIQVGVGAPGTKKVPINLLAEIFVILQSAELTPQFLPPKVQPQPQASLAGTITSTYARISVTITATDSASAGRARSSTTAATTTAARN